jgi:hypothetical protein
MRKGLKTTKIINDRFLFSAFCWIGTCFYKSDILKSPKTDIFANPRPMKITHGWVVFRAWNARGSRGLREGPCRPSLGRRGSRRRTWLGRGRRRRGRRDAGALRGILLLLISLSSVAFLGLGPFATASLVEARNGCMLKSWLQRELGHESNKSVVTLNQGVNERL